MSAQALIWAANVRGMKPATKIVLIQLAERHNKDTGLCNPSIKTLAFDCEMDRTTVMRHIDLLIGFGLISRNAAGNDDGGRANNEYILHMPKAEHTDVSGVVKSQIATGVKSQSDGGLSRNPTGVKSHSCATLTLREPLREPSLFGSEEPHNARDGSLDVDAAFAMLWSAYPKSGRKDKQAAMKKFILAIKRGAHPEAIISAAIAYSAWLDDGQPGEFRPQPKNLETWLNKGSWQDDVPQPVKPLTLADRARRLGPQWGEVVR